MQAERELGEVGMQLDDLTQRLEEADGISSAQVSQISLPLLVESCYTGANASGTGTGIGV